MFKNLLYKNKNILITGASSGLGKNMALNYAKNGGRIINLSRDIKKMESLNEELNNFVDASTGQTEDIIDPLTGNPLPYKGFTFEIKQDTSQDFQYPKRFAIARNIQGIQVLRSESSFASSPEILIEELKFVIDRDNLRAD